MSNSGSPPSNPPELESQGYGRSLFELAVDYLEGKTYKTDLKKALQMLEFSAEDHYAPAQYLLGKLYFDGELTERDSKKGFGLLRDAADQGHAQAQATIWPYYLTGTENVECDISEGIHLLVSAATQGQNNAQLLLSYFYEKGYYVEKDEIAAMDWLKKSAENGNQVARNKLAVAYFFGEGVEQSSLRTHVLFNLAVTPPEAMAKTLLLQDDQKMISVLEKMQENLREKAYKRLAFGHNLEAAFLMVPNPV